jgi:hypothetical protein
VLLGERGQASEVDTAQSAAVRERSPRELRAAYVAALDALGKDREKFFVPNPATRDRLADIRSEREKIEPEAGRAARDESSLRHHRAISATEASLESLLPLGTIAQAITGVAERPISGGS